MDLTGHIVVMEFRHQLMEARPPKCRPTRRYAAYGRNEDAMSLAHLRVAEPLPESGQSCRPRFQPPQPFGWRSAPAGRTVSGLNPGDGSARGG